MPNKSLAEIDRILENHFELDLKEVERSWGKNAGVFKLREQLLEALNSLIAAARKEEVEMFKLYIPKSNRNVHEVLANRLASLEGK